MKRIVAVTVFAVLAIQEVARAEDAPISDGASLDRHLASQRAIGFHRAGWENALRPDASAGAAVAVAEEGISGDVSLNRAVARLDRAALDRGGWHNPYVRDPSYAAGNPLLAARPGEGVTTAGPAGDRGGPSVAAR